MDVLEDTFDVLIEALLKHLISLIQNCHLQVVKLDNLPFKQVK